MSTINEAIIQVKAEAEEKGVKINSAEATFLALELNGLKAVALVEMEPDTCHPGEAHLHGQTKQHQHTLLSSPTRR